VETTKKMLLEAIPGEAEVVAKLAFRASRDGWGIRDFHQRCDQLSSSLVILRTSNGKVCGGFTSKSWRFSLPGWCKDENAFLFNEDSTFPV
jgi:hypothetical protein